MELKLDNQYVGDYGFSQKFINIFCEQNKELYAMNYGIDIYMIIMLLSSNLKFSQVVLGKKIHNSSYSKMLNIFKDVSLSFKKSINTLGINSYEKQNDFEKIKYNGIRKTSRCKFFEYMMENYKIYFEELSCNVYEYDKIQKLWLEKLIEYIKNINNDSVDNELQKYFICYVLAYWKKFEKSSLLNCEKQIWEFAKKLKEEVNGVNSKEGLLESRK